MKRNVLSACKLASKKIAGVLMAGALIFSSCYNDDDLKNSIAGLEGRVAELEASMKAVQEDISSLQSLTEALGNKKTIASVLKNEDGSYTIKFSDNEEIVIRNGEAAPAITIVEEEGVYYWALTGADGVKTFLTDGSGNKMPVTAVAPQVRINAQTKEWEISTDGGKTWTGTDVIASGSGDGSLFKEVTYDDDFAYFTLADGTELKVARSKELKCVILGGKQYFAYDEVKVISVEMSGVSKYTVTKPDGWKVALSGEGLKVTAPAADNSYAEAGGKVAIVAVAANGQSVISEISVVLGEAPIKITSDKTAISTALAADVSAYFLGVSKSEEFDAEAIVATLKENGRLYMKTTALENVELKDLLGEEPEKGAAYMVWAIPATNDELMAEDIISLAVRTASTVLVEVTDITFRGANVSVVRKGCSKYYVGIDTKSYYDPESVLKDLNENSSWVNSLSNDYHGSMLGYDFAGLNKVLPGTTYIIWTIPAVDTDEYTYTADDIIITEVEIPALVPGGSATVTVGDVASELTKVSALLTPSTDCVMYYYTYISESIMDKNYPTDQAVIDYLLKSGRTAEKEVTFTKTDIDPDTKGYMVAVAISEDGKIGNLVKKEANSKPITYSPTVSVNAEATSLGFTSATFTLNATGSPVKYRYVHIQASAFSNYPYQGNEEKVKSNLALNKSVTEIDASSLTDNKLVFDKLLFNTSYLLFVIGVDANGYPSKEVAKVAYSTLDLSSNDIVRKTNPAWSASVPTVTAEAVKSSVGAGNFYDVKYKVTPGANCKEMYIVAGTSFTGMYDEKIKKVLGASGVIKATGTYSGTKLTALPAYISITWIDSDGKYYEVLESIVEKPAE